MEFSTTWLWLENSVQSKVISGFLGAWVSWSMILHLFNKNFNSYVRIFDSDRVRRWKDETLPNLSSLLISAFTFQMEDNWATKNGIYCYHRMNRAWNSLSITFALCGFRWLFLVRFRLLGIGFQVWCLDQLPLKLFPLQLNDACHKIKPFVNAITNKHII